MFSRTRLSTAILSCTFILLIVFLFLKHPTISFEYSNTKQSMNIIPSIISRAKYENIAVLVEFRSIDRLVSVVMNILHHLPSSWPIQIFHGKSNFQFLKNSSALNPLISSGRIFLTEFEREINDNFIENTNKLLTNISFWKQVQGNRVLFFQIDSIMCSNSPHRITDYLHYDYIGAPWDIESCCGLRNVPVGNGGFSLRNRTKIIQLLQIIQWNEEKNSLPEDVWYAMNLRRYLNASIAPVEIAKTFSVESIYYPRPMAVHKLLLSYRHRRRLYETCPEARIIPPYYFFV